MRSVSWIIPVGPHEPLKAALPPAGGRERWQKGKSERFGEGEVPDSLLLKGVPGKTQQKTWAAPRSKDTVHQPQSAGNGDHSPTATRN